MLGFLSLASAKLAILAAASVEQRGGWLRIAFGLAGDARAHVWHRGPAALVAAGRGASDRSVFGGTVMAMAAIAFASMMADAADEHEHLFGARREGLYFAG